MEATTQWQHFDVEPQGTDPERLPYVVDRWKIASLYPGRLPKLATTITHSIRRKHHQLFPGIYDTDLYCPEYPASHSVFSRQSKDFLPALNELVINWRSTDDLTALKIDP